ncbi:MAG: hypothetical protein WCK57_13755, partial [Verrucomicrobiae bacterium]
MATKFLPIPNVGSQIERAVLALLQDAYGDESGNYEYLFSNDWKLRTAPYIQVIAVKSSETVPHTGIETFSVAVEWKWKGNNEAGQTNPDANWKSINDFVGVGMAALSQTAGNNGDPDTLPATVAAEINRLGRALATTDPTNHADMADFTCSHVEFKGSHRAESDGQSLFIKEVRQFEIRACPANV